MNEEFVRQKQAASRATVGDPRFVDYYAKESQSAQTLARFGAICDTVLRVVNGVHRTPRALDVADIGCGAGTLSLMWATRGHRVRGVDVNDALVKLARDRAGAGKLNIDFRVGSAAALPWADASMDVCLLPELLEHVADWRACLRECARVLRADGVLYLTTSNKLCPIQNEFSLPLYGWYPGPIKRYYERLAVTTRPELAGYAKFPAVHWFSFYSLRKEMASLGFRSLDRFDLLRTADHRWTVRLILRAITALPPLRWLGQVATPYTVILAIKERGPQ